MMPVPHRAEPDLTMHEQWRRLLDDAGAVGDDHGGVLHFGNPGRERRAAMSGSVIADLSHYGVIRAGGPDAAAFLQGQLTNDVTRVASGLSRLSGYCTPKGRLLALFRIFPRDGENCLRLPSALVDPTLVRLRKYVLMSKATLEPAGDALTAIGLSGPRCTAELSQAIDGAPPETAGAVAQCGPLTVIRVPGAHPRYEIHGPVDAMTRLWARLDVHAAPVGAGVWTMLDILAGIPEIWPETVEEFLPQSVNLDLLGGVSFDKGCYTGQEIVARLHYRGTPKWRMRIAEAGCEAPRPGAPLYAAHGDGQSAGQVVSAAPAPERGAVMLVSVPAAGTGTGTGVAADLRLGAPDGTPLALRDAPEAATDG